MSRKALKLTLNIALLLAAMYGVSQTIHRSSFSKLVSPIASAVWGS